MKNLNEEQLSELKNIALTQIRPIEKMKKHLLSVDYNLSEEEAEKVSYEILNKAGAELGFQTEYSSCCK